MAIHIKTYWFSTTDAFKAIADHAPVKCADESIFGAI